MSTLEFVPHDGPQVDFFITRTDTKQLSDKFQEIGAVRREFEHYVAYIWHPRMGDLFLSGVGVLDGSLQLGPKKLTRLPQELGAGGYTLVCLEPHRAVVKPDYFGLAPLYHSSTFVTNRLHLAAMATGALNIDSALTAFYNSGGFSFSLNSFETPIKNVRLIPAESEVFLYPDAVVVKSLLSQDDFETLDPDAYWSLISNGANEIINNVTAMTRSGLAIFADLTGGRDSRVVFGALIAAGHQHDVIFNTLTNTTTPALKADLEIATGLVRQYGGSYGGRPSAVGYSVHTVNQKLMRRRSQVFGTYHWIVPHELRPLSTLTKFPSIRMLGGGGELYRDYWKSMLFGIANLDSEPTSVEFSKYLRKYYDNRLGPEILERILPILTNTFLDLPGKVVGHRLDAHYLNFRNRYHFGPRQSLPEMLQTVNVAMVPSLLRAARGLPQTEKDSGRVLFDVTRLFDERLAYLPYDSPNDERIFSSPYHRNSSFDNSSLHLEPAPELAEPSSTTIVRQRAHVPPTDEFDFQNELEREIHTSMERISENVHPFQFLISDELVGLVDWAIRHSPRNKSSLASRLRSLDDFHSATLSH